MSEMVLLSHDDHHRMLGKLLWRQFAAQFSTDAKEAKEAKRMMDGIFTCGDVTFKMQRVMMTVFLQPDSPEVEERKLLATLYQQFGNDNMLVVCMLMFLFKGRLNIRQHLLEELLKLAKKFHFKMLVEAIEMQNSLPAISVTVQIPTTLTCPRTTAPSPPPAGKRKLRAAKKSNQPSDEQSFGDIHIELDEVLCKHCSIRFAEKLKKYEELENQLTCRLCNKFFLNTTCLERHMSVDHLVEVRRSRRPDPRKLGQ